MEIKQDSNWIQKNTGRRVKVSGVVGDRIETADEFGRCGASGKIDFLANYTEIKPIKQKPRKKAEPQPEPEKEKTETEKPESGE